MYIINMLSCVLQFYNASVECSTSLCDFGRKAVLKNNSLQEKAFRLNIYVH